MLLSMTGFGEAHHQDDDVAVSVEVRTVNSRYFKLTVRCLEGYSALEPEIEAVVRQQIRRGAVQVSLRVDRARASEDFRINTEVLDSYRRQLFELQKQWHLPDPVRLEELLQLPGVVIEHPFSADVAEQDWPLIKRTLEESLAHMHRMRIEEGQAMQADLKANLAEMSMNLNSIAARAPQVAEAYRARLTERVQSTIDHFQVTLNPADLVREVSLFAERCDISEEIVRLGSHLAQFDSILDTKDSEGRKLEFLTQEMLRETNTIGSKANDVEISRHVVDIKAAIERIREMIQNVE